MGPSACNAGRLAHYGRTFMLENVLSPELERRCGPAESEVLTALFYILDCMAGLKLTPHFLTKAEVAAFYSMKSGRYSRK